MRVPSILATRIGEIFIVFLKLVVALVETYIPTKTVNRSISPYSPIKKYLTKPSNV